MPKLQFNEPPSAPVVGIDPAVPTTVDALNAVILTEAVDGEGNGFTYHYEWFADDVSVGTGPTLAASVTQKDQVIVLRAAADDGEFTGDAGEATVTIANTAPADATVEISPSNPLTSDDLTLTLAASDADGEALTWAITWSRDGVEVPEFTGDEVVPASATGSGESWSVEATPSDATGAGPMATASVRVDDTAPTLGSLAMGPSDAVYGETLGVSAVGVEDTDGDALTVHYAWFINGSVVAEHDGGESDVLATTILRGDEVYVRAYVTDGQLTSDTLSSNTITIGDTAPTLSVVELSPDPAYEPDTLSCSPADGADVDGDTIRYAYGWTVNGALVAASTSTLTGSYFSRGSTVSCSATPSDDGATGAIAYSGEVVIANSLPTFGSVTISPATAVTGDTLSSSVTGWSDADGDAEHRIYSWVVDGVVGGSGATLPGVARGEVIYLEVTPNDGTDDGATVTSNTITVGNATPRITGASISPTTLYNDSTPVATPTGFTDADGDSPSYRYQWYLNGVAASGETSATLASPLTIGEQVQVRIWPSDGTIEGSNVASSALTVQNRAPVASAAVLDADPILTCDEIQLSALGSSEADGTALTYAWTVNSRPAGAVRTTTDLDSASDAEPYFVVDADGTWIFGLLVSDGSLTDTDSVSIAVEPRGYNTDPVADAGADLVESTESACSTSGHGTVCVPCPTVEFSLDGSGSVDADGDPLVYSWLMASAPWASLSGSTTVDPVLSIGGMTPTYGVTTTVTVTLTLTTADCAEGDDSDSVTVTYECTGI